MSSTEGAVMVNGSVGIPSVDLAGSGKMDPPLLQMSLTHMCHKFSSPYVLLLIFVLGDNFT